MHNTDFLHNIQPIQLSCDRNHWFKICWLQIAFVMCIHSFQQLYLSTLTSYMIGQDKIELEYEHFLNPIYWFHLQNSNEMCDSSLHQLDYDRHFNFYHFLPCCKFKLLLQYNPTPLGFVIYLCSWCQAYCKAQLNWYRI